jgi:pimeloyl-ACP methyl ester carboxylesterase
VAQSLGGDTAPIVCSRVPSTMLVRVAGMVPSPGESANEMLANTGYRREEQDDSSSLAIFYPDVPPALAKEALAKGRKQSDTPGNEPWPLKAWPEVPTRFLLCRHDRMFPAKWLRRVVRERLGVTPDEIDSGHTPALSRPTELADRLEAYRTGMSAGPRSGGAGIPRPRGSH